MSVKIDLTGRRYGKLKVLRLEVDIPGKKKKWLCRCDCGNEVIVAGSNLQSGHTKQCVECGHKETTFKRTTHNLTGTRLYNIWGGMITRCECEKSNIFPHYGGRGIKVCEEWHDSSKFFEWAFSNGYREDLEIDRIDVNGDYCPENCRWVTRIENANNKRNNTFVEHNGEVKTVSEWARFYGVNRRNLSRNLLNGYTLEEAVQREKTGDRTHRGSKKWRAKHGK